MMLLRVYVILEEGADRPYVSTTYPAWYKRPKDRASRIVAIDAPISNADRVDQIVRVTPDHVTYFGDD